jgi:CHAD domain-containing protein
VLAYLAVQGAALRAGDHALRTGDPTGVHDSRVAARRARSTLRTFRKVFDKEAARALDTSLREYAARLGEVRDLQVLASVLAEHAEGELATRLTSQVQRELAAAWQRLERELDATDHRQLSDQMAAVVLAPTEATGLGKQVRRAVRSAEEHLERAGGDADRLHTARKAAKRARYASEAVGDLSLAAGLKKLQDVLGRHRDLVVAADWVTGAQLPEQLHDAAEELVAGLRADADRTRVLAVL